MRHKRTYDGVPTGPSRNLPVFLTHRVVPLGDGLGPVVGIIENQIVAA